MIKNQNSKYNSIICGCGRCSFELWIRRPPFLVVGGGTGSRLCRPHNPAGLGAGYLLPAVLHDPAGRDRPSDGVRSDSSRAWIHRRSGGLCSVFVVLALDFRLESSHNFVVCGFGEWWLDGSRRMDAGNGSFYQQYCCYCYGCRYGGGHCGCWRLFAMPIRIHIRRIEKVFPLTIILTAHFYSGRIKFVRHINKWVVFTS